MDTQRRGADGRQLFTAEFKREQLGRVGRGASRACSEVHVTSVVLSILGVPKVSFCILSHFRVRTCGASPPPRQ